MKAENGGIRVAGLVGRGDASELVKGDGNVAKSVHYSGGIRGVVGKWFTTRLRGWPACGRGMKYGEILPGTEYDDEESSVTCAKCLKLIAANKAYHKELGERFAKVSHLADATERRNFPHYGGHNATDLAGALVRKLEKQKEAVTA